VMYAGAVCGIPPETVASTATGQPDGASTSAPRPLQGSSSSSGVRDPAARAHAQRQSVSAALAVVSHCSHASVNVCITLRFACSTSLDNRAAMVNVNVELRNEAVHRSLAAFEDDDDAFRQTLHPGIEWCPIEENRVSLHGVEAAVRLRLGSSRTGLSAWRSTSRRPGPVSRRSRDTGSSPSAVPAPRLRRRPGPRPGSPMSSPPAGWTRVVRSGSGARTGRARR
jgi:hypothetical protein